MSDAAAAARAKIAALKAEIARLEDFLDLYAELSRADRPVSVDVDVIAHQGADGGNETPHDRPVDNSQPVDKAATRRRSGIRPTQIAEIMQRIIRDAGRPMTRGEIVAALEARDVQIPYEDKARYIGTIAWRHKGIFRNIEGQGYWLSGEAIPRREGELEIELDDDLPY